MPESSDVNALKRRGRRRLVGAVALVLVAVIVLPMVFDSEPKSPAPPVSVRIPGEDESGFSPKVTPRGEPVPNVFKPAPAAESPKTVAPPSQPAAEKPVAEKPVAEKAAEKPPAATPALSVAPEEKKRAENALADAGFVIALGAYADEKNIRALMSKLKTEKIPAYTEPLETPKGPRTRVRAGPFLTEEAAEKARARLVRIGIQPGPVAPRAG
jgi:DedD protein